MSTTYDIYTSQFHGTRYLGETATFVAAARKMTCARSCLCGGGHIEVDGKALYMSRLPSAVLLGQREPTAREIAVAAKERER